jgi:hypothetical protein
MGGNIVSSYGMLTLPANHYIKLGVDGKNLAAVGTAGGGMEHVENGNIYPGIRVCNPYDWNAGLLELGQWALEKNRDHG